MSYLRRSTVLDGRFQNPVPTSVGGFGIFLKIFWQYLTNKEERVPARALGPFRTDVRVFETVPASGLRVTWMGHSTLLIEMDGVRILADPIWDQRASPVEWAGPKRFYEPTMGLGELPRIDLILISHNHYDHFGNRTIARLAGCGAKWVTSLGVGAELQQCGVKGEAITELDWTDSLELEGLKVTALPARHFSGRGVWDRFRTLWSSFVLKSSRHKVYYGADSGMWPGFAEIGREYGPFDLTMLEVGAYNELWKSIHMGPVGAGAAFHELGGAGLLMPIHWGLFDLALHDWREPIRWMREVADQNGIRLWSPKPGEPTEVVAGVEVRSDWWVG